MRALIVYASKTGSAARLASHIATGCRAAGVEPELHDLKDSYKIFDYVRLLPSGGHESISHDLSNYDLIFVGFEIHNLSESSKLLQFIEKHDFSGKKVALFCSYFANKKFLSKIIGKFAEKKADVFNTLSLKRKGMQVLLGRGNLDENDLIRAEAFAERTINNLLGRRVTKPSEKGQIRNYWK